MQIKAKSLDLWCFKQTKLMAPLISLNLSKHVLLRVGYDLANISYDAKAPMILITEYVVSLIY